MKNDPEAIDMQVVNFFGRQYWKGRLRANFAAFVCPRHNEVLFAGPRDIVVSQLRVAPKGTASGKLQIADRTLSVNLNAEAFGRLQSWLQAQQSAVPASASIVS